MVLVLLVDVVVVDAANTNVNLNLRQNILHTCSGCRCDGRCCSCGDRCRCCDRGYSIEIVNIR